MATDFTGMINQLNQSIKGFPTEQASGLLGHASSEFGQLAGGLFGNAPEEYMGQRGKQVFGQEQLSGLNLQTADGLAKAAEIYGMMGNTQNQVAMAQAAQKQALTEQAAKRTQQTRENLAQRATKLGLTGVAENVLSGEGDLKEIAKVIRDEELVKIAAVRTGPARKGLARNQFGIDEQEFNEAGLGDMSPEEFKDYINSREADLKPMLDSTGSIVNVPVSKGGRVKDPKTGEWMWPSDAGMSTAPNVQKVIDASSKFSTKMAEAGVAEFVNLHEKANNAQLQLDNIDRSLANLENMPTGIGAPIEHFFGRVADYMGMERPSVANYEVFVAEAGKRVAEQIKAFGSGTGLSDADREYAKLISAADPALKAESLRRLLEIQKESMTETVNIFTDVKASTRQEMGGDGYLIDVFRLRAPASKEAGASALTYDPATGKWSDEQ